LAAFVGLICAGAARHNSQNRQARKPFPHFAFVFSHAFLRLCGSVVVDEPADQAGKRLMLGARFASSEKVSELDFSRRSAGRHVGFVQDEGASIVVATQQPPVAVLEISRWRLHILGLRAETINRDPISFPANRRPRAISPSPSASSALASRGESGSIRPGSNSRAILEANPQ
jgi:hypothetical protein